MVRRYQDMRFKEELIDFLYYAFKIFFIVSNTMLIGFVFGFLYHIVSATELIALSIACIAVSKAYENIYDDYYRTHL